MTRTTTVATGEGLFGGRGGNPALLPSLVVAAGAVLSGVAVWVPTQSFALVGGFVGMGLLGSALVWSLRSRNDIAVAEVETGNDWSLVRSVAEIDGSGVAITDRTGRLVCANDVYCDWFGGAVTPPALPVDQRTAALLAACP